MKHLLVYKCFLILAIALILPEGVFAQAASRLKAAELRIPLVKKADGLTVRSGLTNKIIALWASHGYYYESGLDRWEWKHLMVLSLLAIGRL